MHPVGGGCSSGLSYDLEPGLQCSAFTPSFPTLSQICLTSVTLFDVGVRFLEPQHAAIASDGLPAQATVISKLEEDRASLCVPVTANRLQLEAPYTRTGAIGLTFYTVAVADSDRPSSRQFLISFICCKL